MAEGFETLTVTMKPYSSRLLAGLCVTAGRGVHDACPFPWCQCPIGLDPLCSRARPKHWDKVLGRKSKKEDEDENHASETR